MRRWEGLTGGRLEVGRPNKKYFWAPKKKGGTKDQIRGAVPESGYHLSEAARGKRREYRGGRPR